MLTHEKPHVITLCGSTRFKDEIRATDARLTIAGNVVISLGVFGHVDMPEVDWTTGGNELKALLDRLHMAKIDLADSIYVVNVGGYIGESTSNEIAYAEATGKPVHYLEDVTGKPVDVDWPLSTDYDGQIMCEACNDLGVMLSAWTTPQAWRFTVRDLLRLIAVHRKVCRKRTDA